jgi:hypothetical protein
MRGEVLVLVPVIVIHPRGPRRPVIIRGAVQQSQAQKSAHHFGARRGNGAVRYYA